MAGTLTISTLSDGTNSTSSTNCIQGSAKAWVNFNNTGGVIASYNVGSVTKNASGDYTVTFASSLSDANYCFVGSMVTDSNVVLESIVGKNGGTKTTSAFQLLCLYSAGAAGNSPSMCIAFFR